MWIAISIAGIFFDAIVSGTMTALGADSSWVGMAHYAVGLIVGGILAHYSQNKEKD